MSARPAGAIRRGEAASTRGADPKTFLSFYSERFDTVELNTTGYRCRPRAVRALAEQTQPGFTFAVKMPLTRLDRVGTFVERVQALGDRLGPVRIVVQSPRDDGMLEFVQGSLPPELLVAWDFRTRPGTTSTAIVRVDDFDAEPFRYIRLREAAVHDDDLRAVAERLRPPAYVYFRHEDEPSAPEYARRLAQITR
jgi:uncharacterized protein YecE (DUF72 family)